MKKFLGLLPVFISLFVISACGQGDKSKRPSPPASTEMKAGTATIKINYSAPSVKGREIWGKLVPYGEVWRTGANEATTFETDADIKVEGQTLPKGKYALFTIPGKDEWVIIFNKTADQWGAFNYKKENDALRVTVRPGLAPAMQEQLKIEGHVDGSVSIVWEKIEVIFTVTR
ncbi:MAG: DUF2911 domain-containing protein [Chitinophagaceae bacterium]|nr:DUF2911 domain-containing protein [Chitinophagaceae bacterium]